MDITFKCPHCEQELEVDATGAGSQIECPACSNTITVPIPEAAEVAAGDARAALAPVAAAPAKEEKHFAVPVHEHTPAALIHLSKAKSLDIIAKEGDKTLRIKTIKRTDCQEVGKDHFDETVSAFLEKVGHVNIVSIHSINYSFMELSTRHILTDYGVMIVFKG
jgi:hypothetical protein